MARLLSKYLALSPSDKLFLPYCVLVVASVRLGLWILTYKTMRRLIPRTARMCDAEKETLSRISWGVAKAARFVPQATCLTQALSAQFLLARKGHASHIRIGVAREPGGEFAAHAWLISGNQIIIGGSARELERYIVLTDL